MKKFKVLLLILFVSGIQYSQEPWTLEACVNRALEMNISIKQSQLDYVNSEIDKKGAIGNFLPNLNVGGSHSWNVGLNQNITTGLLENVTTQFSSMNLNVNVDLYNGLQNVKRLHRANLSLLASQYQLEDMSENVALLVANSYLQVLFSKEALAAQKLQLDITQRELERTKKLISSGVIPKGDIYEVEASLASQEKSVVDAQNAFYLTKISLAQLLLIDDYENFKIANEQYDIPVSDILSKTPTEIFSYAVENKKDIKLIETNVEIAKKDLEISKALSQPRLSAFYSYSSRIGYSDRIVPTGELDFRTIGVVEGTGQNVVAPYPVYETQNPLSFSEQFDLNAGQNFGISLSIPILNNFSTKNNIQRSKINILRSVNSLEQKKLDLENTVNQSYNDAKGAIKAYQASVKLLAARKQAFEYASDKFEVGTMNSFDFSQAKQRYELAQFELIRTKYDYIFKLKVLEFYFGVPITVD
jgi:outer membrane protein